MGGRLYFSHAPAILRDFELYAPATQRFVICHSSKAKCQMPSSISREVGSRWGFESTEPEETYRLHYFDQSKKCLYNLRDKRLENCSLPELAVNIIPRMIQHFMISNELQL